MRPPEQSQRAFPRVPPWLGAAVWWLCMVVGAACLAFGVFLFSDGLAFASKAHNTVGVVADQRGAPHIAFTAEGKRHVLSTRVPFSDFEVGDAVPVLYKQVGWSMEARIDSFWGVYGGAVSMTSASLAAVCVLLAVAWLRRRAVQPRRPSLPRARLV